MSAHRRGQPRAGAARTVAGAEDVGREDGEGVAGAVAAGVAAGVAAAVVEEKAAAAGAAMAVLLEEMIL